MRNFVVFLSIVAICGMGSCRDKDPEIPQILELSAEMMDYFVNYEVGSKWIYQDTIDTQNYDTIELISKKPFDVTEDGTTVTKGFELYYKPHKSKDFKVRVTPGVNKIYYVKIDPMVTAAGAIVFENNNGAWITGVTYYDSLQIFGTQYYQVVKGKGTNMYQYYMHFSKMRGIVFFRSRDVDKLPITGADYKLINTITP